MRKIIVEIEREKAEYIERLNFELGFAKDVIQRIIESHPNDPDVINSEAFKAYQKKKAKFIKISKTKKRSYVKTHHRITQSTSEYFTNNQQLKLPLCYSVFSVMSFDNLVYNKAAVCLFLQIPILICLSTCFCP